MARWLTILIIITFLTGCGLWNTKPDTVTVYIPVPIEIEVPEELQERYEINETVTFISPLDENAFAAMDAENTRSFQLMILHLLNRIRQWEAFYLSDDEE